MLFIYSFEFRYVGTGDTIPAELLPFAMREGTTALDSIEPSGVQPSGVQPNGELPYYLIRSGEHIYSAYPIAAGLLNSLTYAVLGLFAGDQTENPKDLAHLTSVWVSALSVALFFLIVLNLTQNYTISLFATMYFAFGTVMWSVVSRGLWQHGPAILFLHIAILMRMHRRDYLAVFFAGCCICARVQCAVLLLPLLLGLAYERRNRLNRLFFLAASFSVAPAVTESYNIFVLDRPLLFLQTGILGVHGFGINPLPGLAGLLFNPSRGLFVFSPVLLLGTYAAAKNWSRFPPIVKQLLLGVVAMIAMTSFWTIWWGGHSFAYRVISEVASPLTIASALFLTSINNKVVILITAIFTGVSFFIHYLGSYYYPCGWNDRPQPITGSSERLWSIADSELTKCAIRWYHKNSVLNPKPAKKSGP